MSESSIRRIHCNYLGIHMDCQLKWKSKKELTKHRCSLQNILTVHEKSCMYMLESMYTRLKKYQSAAVDRWQFFSFPAV